ncbi:unnamed protein product, partial [Mesorhabditis spiculigera]
MTFLKKFRYFTYRVTKRLGLTALSPLFFFATGFISVHVEPTVIKTCATGNYTDFQTYPATISTGCSEQRRALLSFVVYCCVRLFTYKFEELVSSSEVGCLARTKVPGMHLGFSLALPFLVRLPFVPSQTTTRIRRELEGRIVQIRDLEELQRLVPCDVQHGPKKKNHQHV